MPKTRIKVRLVTHAWWGVLMGKGDHRRPAQVPESQLLENWEKIFGKKYKVKTEKKKKPKK
jgi:hypothetical protein